MKEFRDNKPLIQAHLKGQSVEGLTNTDARIMGMGITSFLILFLIATAIWIWAIVSLIKYWSVLPDWAKIVGILSILGILGGPIVTLIVVYIAKQPKSAYTHRL
jgi:hypothetical protein